MKSVFRISILIWIIGICSLSALVSCATGESSPRVRSVYYWNTNFNIDSVKRDFLLSYDIDKIYVRYFDVVRRQDSDMPVPNATIRIDSIPRDLSCEIVPVVFILPDALYADAGMLAGKIFSRIKQMNDTHGVPPIKELQIDCDWTVSTRNLFYGFMDTLRHMTTSEGIALSATIRLHQLASSPPPADKGVLMVYNTGDMRDLNKEKPILDPGDVMPYLRYLKDYPLPLVTAYPIYKWDLLFRNGKFVDIVHGPDDVPILKSDTVVTRMPSPEDILSCRNAIEGIRPECASEIILFDLNNYNIKRYDNATFENLYN